MIEITSEADLFHIVRHSFSFFVQGGRHEHKKSVFSISLHSDCAIKLDHAVWGGCYIQKFVRDNVSITRGKDTEGCGAAFIDWLWNSAFQNDFSSICKAEVRHVTLSLI